jgi:hypothetical protein
MTVPPTGPTGPTEPTDPPIGPPPGSPIGPLTDEEKQVLKTGAFGAVYLVSHADPGFFSMLRESMAASGALAGSTGLVRDVLTGGGQPRVPREPPEAVEAVVLPALRESMSILGAKAPGEVRNYRDTVLSAARRVAAASHGIQAAEAAAIEKIRAALGVGGGGAHDATDG